LTFSLRLGIIVYKQFREDKNLNDFKEIMDQLKDMGESRKLASDAIKLIFQNKNHSVSDRWEIFCEAVESNAFCEENCYGMDFDFMKENSWEWYDDFCHDRYKTVCLVDLVGQIDEMWWGEIAFTKDEQILSDQEFDEMIEPRLNAVKEEIMQSGYSSFVFDW